MEIFSKHCQSQTIIAGELKFWENVHPPPCVRCQVSGVILVEFMAGKEHFELATILRNSCLVSSLVFNCEAWYGLTLKQVKVLEKVDENLMRKVKGCPSKTPIHLMYLELGWPPLRFTIQSRRLNFLKYMLNQSESSLVKQVFNEQKSNLRKVTG